MSTMVAVLREVWRVLRVDGTVWLNLGDSYANDTKWGGQTSGKHARSLHGKAPLVRARKTTGLKSKDLIGIPWRVALALQADGWYLRSDIIWAKPNPMPESVTDRPTRSHEYLFLLTKAASYYYDAKAIAEPVSGAMLDQVEQGYDGLGLKDYEAAGVQNPSSVKARIIANARLKGNAKTFRGGGAYTAGQSFQNDASVARDSHGNTPNLTLTRNKRSVWTIPTAPYHGAHFATFPERLVEPCILAGCPMGGLVLDPFIGSGTVGAVADRTGRRWVGTDLSYQHLSAERTQQRGLSW